MEKAVGVFQHEKSEGMDEYLTTLGVPWMVRLVFFSLKNMRENNMEIYRKVLTNTSPTVEIVGEGEEWNMTFKVGVSFVTFLKNDASEVNLKKFPWKHHSVNTSISPQC